MRSLGSKSRPKVFHEVMGAWAGGMSLTISLHGEDVHEHAKLSPLWVEVIVVLVVVVVVV